MPYQVLVTYGVVFCLGLSVLPGSAWCSNLSDVLTATDFVHDKTPKAIIDITEDNHETSLTLTLEEAIQLTLQENPELSVFNREIDARTFEAKQAGLYINPEVSIEVENFAGSGDFTGTDIAETTFLLSQQIELASKRKHRQTIGLLEKKMAERDFDAFRAELVAKTSARFFNVLVAQKRLALAEEQKKHAKKVLATVDENIDSGKTARIERVRFQALVTEATLRQNQAYQAMATASYALTALWDQADKAGFVTAQGHLEQLPVIPEWIALADKLQQGPLNALQQTVIQKAERQLTLERANRIPNLTLSFGAKKSEETSDSALVAGVAFSLPIFDRNQGSIKAAKVRQLQAKEIARAAQLSLQTELRNTWQKLQTYQNEISTLRDELLPAGQQSFEAIIYGYQVGKFGFLEVLDAEKTLFELKNRYLDNLDKFYQTYTEIERILGSKIVSNTERPVAFVNSLRGQS